MKLERLTALFRTMLTHSIPTRQVFSENHPNSIDFWGSDGRAWMIQEDLPTIEILPEQSLGPSFSLVGEALSAYDEFLTELRLDQRINQAVHSTSLAKVLEKLLRHYYSEKSGYSDDEIAQAIRKEILEIKNSITEWTAIAPVDFLVLENLPELVVGNVLFTTGAEALEFTLEQFKTRIDANTTSPKDKADLKAFVDGEMRRAIRPQSVVARVRVEGESNRIKVLAEEEIQNSLNLLRCYTSVLFGSELRVKMGLRHETGYYFRPSIGFSSTDESWNLSFDNVGVNQNFMISPQTLDHLKARFAFQELSQIIAKPVHKRSKLERLIVTSIRWLGSGVTLDDKANKVLHYSAASETLIMGQISEAEITEKFSRRLAFLVGRDREERAAVYARAKGLYNKRSKVIHAGSTDIEDADVVALEFFTLRSLVEMAKRSSDWKTHEDFTNWFNSVSF